MQFHRGFISFIQHVKINQKRRRWNQQYLKCIKKLAVYLVYDGLCIKKEQFNGGVILQVGYTLYVEPENTEENINTPAASK